MISQRCPRCGSKRIKRGYRATPFFAKLFFYFNLLCDNCNWEFRGFAIPFLGKKKSKKYARRKESDPAFSSVKSEQEIIDKE